MGTSTTTANAILLLVFNATAWANYADNAAGTPQTNISMSLNTADPGAGGTMATSEIGYTSYARVDVARSSGGWTITSNAVSPVASIGFPAGTGGSGTASFFCAGKTGGGSAAILWSGTVTPNIVTGNGITPSLTTASTITIT